MILLGKRIIIEFEKSHPHSRNSLSVWEQIIKKTDYKHFNELKKTFPHVDYVNHRYMVFNISGNKYRLITEIDFVVKVINLKRIWTHAEYSMKKNEDALRRGTL